MIGRPSLTVWAHDQRKRDDDDVGDDQNAGRTVAATAGHRSECDAVIGASVRAKASSVRDNVIHPFCLLAAKHVNEAPASRSLCHC